VTDKETKQIISKIYASAREWRERLVEAVDREVEEFVSARRQYDEARRKEEARRRRAGERNSRFRGFVRPRVMWPSAKARRKTTRIYWQLLVPLALASREAGELKFTSEHIKKGRKRNGYVEADLAKFCVEGEIDLVMSTERRLRKLEEAMTAQMEIENLAKEYLND
jgi:hypothetical protein